ncbi:HAD family hydrolase [Streptosporangium sp. NBC_01755]|uniref:HAD family hydrolase n=1 Tax=unclassified Streptosporangium TaxID=2632669 RepID=UPI002DD92BBF|nr:MULTISPECIES: HAD family hydrolase [unclassified Streptosporangium]WSA26717.1 HAD family hydrolase [Streptosporangium sp. NBC_01810]WSD01859.1 HAD family hydrolase [Streptosporangium sp. NBC_01755]
MSTDATAGQAAPLKAVVFDWGGTITPWNLVPRQLQWLAAGALLDGADPERAAAALAAAETEIWSIWAETSEVASILTVPRMAADTLGVELPDGLADEVLAAHLETMAPNIHARPEARRALAALKERDLLVGILTSSHWPRSWHERLFEEDGLADLLDVCVCGSDLKRAKPDPDSFLTVLRILGVTPAEAVFVADSPWDISGAQAVGMRAIWLPNGLQEEEGTDPEAIVTDLVGVVDVVDRWLDPVPLSS